MKPLRFPILVATTAFAIACSSAGSSGASSSQQQSTPSSTDTPTSCRTGFVAPGRIPNGSSPAGLPAGFTLPPGFTGAVIARVPRARELAIAPNGDLFVATEGNQIYIVPHADDVGSAGAPHVFWTDNNGDAPNAGITLSLQECALYVAGNTSVWMIHYHPGDQTAPYAQQIASVRTGPVSPGTDGDIHQTTSLAFTQGSLYVSVGSSCNSCTEADPTRAAVLRFSPTGGTYTIKATRIRNAIALAVDPTTGHLWVGDAGQDDLPFGHPYEFADDLTAHAGRADYGWPECEENHNPFSSGANCSSTVAPLVELPAYSTLIGATFYPADQTGIHAFPSRYRGGLFIAAHGSWHRTTAGAFAAIPQVAFVAMNGDIPATAVDWSNPTTQWKTFLGGFQESDSTTRIGRPTGVAVGPTGSLFVSDDLTGNIYRIRPAP